MDYALSHIIARFREQMLLTQKETYPSILASYFAFWKNYASLLELLSKNNTTYLLFGRYLECRLTYWSMNGYRKMLLPKFYVPKYLVLHLAGWSTSTR